MLQTSESASCRTSLKYSRNVLCFFPYQLWSWGVCVCIHTRMYARMYNSLNVAQNSQKFELSPNFTTAMCICERICVYVYLHFWLHAFLVEQDSLSQAEQDSMSQECTWLVPLTCRVSIGQVSARQGMWHVRVCTCHGIRILHTDMSIYTYIKTHEVTCILHTDTRWQAL